MYQEVPVIKKKKKTCLFLKMDGFPSLQLECFQVPQEVFIPKKYPFLHVLTLFTK